LETKGERTRGALLAAAIGRFGRDGYRGTSVADIARDAGVGGTAAYAYFPGKEALFFAAVDEDAARMIERAREALLSRPRQDDWYEHLFTTLVAASEQHPLARRLLAGREPEVTPRVLEVPSLVALRRLVAERLGEEQARGTVRSDVDPAAMANGIVAVMLSLLMSVVQLGERVALPYAADVTAVFRAALDPPGSPN
jgi:AcrR family transcriptional regulator